MLLGRDRELAFIGVMLDEARGGLSRSLIVHGDPGIGKTALLEEAVKMALGFTVLRARPLEAESELPFAGLSDLLRPLLVYLERIPGPQAAVLSGAFALGPPTPGDRFTGAVATISLLAAGAEDAPVFVVVDDAHWLDTPSREALLFAASRLRGDRVVLLLAMRDRPWRETSRVEQLELRGLAADAAVELIARSGKVVSRDVRDRLVEARVELRRGGSPMTLTPQELHVALAVAEGATNKEAAAALFISAKTVEFHLSHIYRKLGLRSRSELARHIAGRSPRRETN